MLTHKDMNVGMEKIKDARRADEQKQLIEQAQGTPSEGRMARVLLTIGQWLVDRGNTLQTRYDEGTVTIKVPVVQG